MAKFRFSFHRKNNKSNEKDSLQHVPPLSSWTIRDGNTAAPFPPPKPKKKMGSRLWMRLEHSGESELLECDKNVIMKCASLPARDLRILGPIFSHSSNILAREKAIVVNLEFIKAIVTTEEVLLLDPLCQEVISFVDQLRQHFPVKSSDPSQIRVENKETQSSIQTQSFPAPETSEGLHHELPFEFQVLEIALEVVCSYLDAKVLDLEKNAYPVLDELARRVSTKNLERVRSLKSNLTQLLARVQKVRDEIEHLLDDNEDMEHLYLTRKMIQNQQYEALSSAMTNGVVPVTPSLRRLNSNIYSNASLGTSAYSDDHDVEDLEMLLEAYFMQLEGMRNKILSVREYIDDTEDYVNIQLDNQRNELIQLQLTLIIASFAICIETYIATAFGMNIPCQFYKVHGIFGMFVGGISSVCFFVFLLLLAYARWMKLLG